MPGAVSPPNSTSMDSTEEKQSVGIILANFTFSTAFNRKLEHPLYVLGFGLLTCYDFSLLRLETTIDLTRFPNVRPVCWPSRDPGQGQQVTCRYDC